jgi:hypothetical protein
VKYLVYETLICPNCGADLADKEGEKTNMRTNTFLVFRNGKLVSVVTTTMDNYNDAVDCDRYLKNPENAKKQIKEWKRVKIAV